MMPSSLGSGKAREGENERPPNEIMATQIKAAGSTVDPHEISREELRRRLHDSSLIIVDVLPEESYVAAHIPSAINLPLEEIAGRARELLPDLTADIAVYCGKFT
jgi:hypothetical protein